MVLVDADAMCVPAAGAGGSGGAGPCPKWCIISLVPENNSNVKNGLKKKPDTAAIA